MKGYRLALLVAATVLVTQPIHGQDGNTSRRRAAGDPVDISSIRVGTPRPGGGYEVRTIGLEDYVAQVVAGEAAARSNPAALETLAITARTFALANKTRHAADGFDLCNTTHCQVLRLATTATRASADATASRVLLFNGQPAQVFYSASCGGYSERASAVWPRARDLPFIVSKPDPACNSEPAWESDISSEDLTRALHASGYRGNRVTNLRIVARTGSGRVARMIIDGLQPAEISGSDLRLVIGQALDWRLLKSAAFDVRRMGSTYHFAGHGAGHGVGLCVMGSARLAEQGQSAQTILTRYFPGLAIGPATKNMMAMAASTPSPAVRVPATSAISIALPEGAESERPQIEHLVTAIVGEVVARAGMKQPGRLTIRFHPSIESFRRYSTQPWWVGATTSGREVQLLPVSVLRSRGDLERVLRREIARTVTSPLLEGRPEWVKEGAAMHFGDHLVGPAPARLTCPSDFELVASASPGAFRDATVRAAACFDRQIAAGRHWTEIR